MTKRDEWSPKKKKIISGILVALSLLLMGLLCWLIGKPMVQLASQPEEFRLWVDRSGAWGRLAFIGMVIFQVFAAVIPGEVFEIAAGYAFGAVEGTILSVAATGLGSLLVFMLVRRFGMRLVELFFSREKLQSLRFLQSSPKRDALLFLIYALPGTPKDMIGYFAGLTDISFKKWAFIAFVGRFPSVVTSTIGGNALGLQDYSMAVVVFLITMGISGLGVLAYKGVTALQAKRSEKKDKQTKE